MNLLYKLRGENESVVGINISRVFTRVCQLRDHVVDALIKVPTVSRCFFLLHNPLAVGDDDDKTHDSDDSDTVV